MLQAYLSSETSQFWNIPGKGNCVVLLPIQMGENRSHQSFIFFNNSENFMNQQVIGSYRQASEHFF